MLDVAVACLSSREGHTFESYWVRVTASPRHLRPSTGAAFFVWSHSRTSHTPWSILARVSPCAFATRLPAAAPRSPPSIGLCSPNRLAKPLSLHTLLPRAAERCHCGQSGITFISPFELRLSREG